ncbi:Hypothetical protein PENO1_095750 [Penicillium occitanis (nom. inval.)]|nr:Hypothetical protein PENO1_095750 [Penicillium occitanis (nom. inval.)]PCG91752.1 hypothetical protein PENOC_095820 [Penicillium occitanis (nom. inval.)]
MAPIWLAKLASSAATQQLFSRETETASSDPTSTAGSMALQWRQPAGILDVLLLVGAPVVRCAIAQLAGRIVTPVAFSFGWVGYAVSVVLSSFGDGRLMPESETSLMVVDTNSGHGRTTSTWVIGRLFRDFNDRLMESMKDEEPHISSDVSEVQTLGSASEKEEKIVTKRKPFEGLRVTVFEVEENPPTPHGVPTLDWVWYSGCVVIIVQLGIAAVPWVANGRWDTFLVTAAGNLFSLIGGSIPQWRREKWACPKNGSKDHIIITEGNGSRSAMVILGKKDVGLKFEVLARSTRLAPATVSTKLVTSLLAVLWILLLITVAGIVEDTWYLLGIGLLGSIQNLIAAGVHRSPAALGIHIREVDTIRARFVAETLKEVEHKYPRVGTSLLDIFFPGSMRIKEENTEDITFWRAALERRLEKNKHGIRLDRLPPAAQQEKLPR